MKRAFFFLLLGYALPLAAQYRVSGSVKSEQEGSVLEMATVCLYHHDGGDSVLVRAAQTDAEGHYRLDDTPAGRYKLHVSMVGYVPRSLSVEVKDKDVVLPAVALPENVQLLGVLDVKGQAAEMTVKGDTIEYNTAAYKVGENAMVEDLLKKMNGVEVDKEGNVTVNGETIKGVRVDGKKFFGDDVQSATKNIPAEMIDKIQVIDNKSDMAKLTGFEDDDTERIINLTLKANRKKGVFGNYNGGVGIDIQKDFRYSAGLFTNILLGESQTTIIGSANNTNDIRSGRGRGPFAGQNSGITWAENLGVNTNIDLTGKINKKDNTSSLMFGSDAGFNHSKNELLSRSDKDSYANEVTYTNKDSLDKQSKAWDVNARFELEYRIDTLNKLIIKPNISYKNSRSDSRDRFLYFRKDSLMQDSVINNGSQDQLSESEEIGVNVRAIYNHLFLKPGRSFTLNANVAFTDTKGYSETKAKDMAVDTMRVNQYTRSGNDAVSYSVKASYVEPLHGVNHLLEMAFTFQSNNRFSHKDQYDFSKRDSAYKYNPDYSNKLENRFYSEALEVNYRWVNKQCDLMVGVKVNPSQTWTKTYYGGVLLRDTLINVWNWSPNASFKYRFGKKEFARIIYRGTSSQPSINQMEPVRNNSDAMNETVGNLGLNPAFRHTLRFMYSKFNQETFASLMTGLHGDFTKDALVNNTVYDETGKRYQQTVNANAIPWNIGGDLMFTMPFAKKLMQFHSRTALSYNQQIAYIYHEGKATEISRWIESGDFMLGDLSKTGNLNVRQDLTLRLTHDIVDVGVRGQVNYSRTKNTLTSGSVTNVIKWSVTGDVVFHLPKSWNISADCGYTARYGYQLDDVDEISLNASIDKTWGNATLMFKVYDILNDEKNIVQVVGENYVQYKKTNTLPTYFMLTFTYKLNKMGDLKAKGMAGHVQEMMESGFDPTRGPRPGMMPPGPPPGR